MAALLLASATTGTPALAADFSPALREAVQLDPVRGERLAAEIERKALSAPPSTSRDRDVLTARYFRAEALITLNRSGEAAVIADQALMTLPATMARTKLHGQLLMVRAGAASDGGNAASALADLHTAYQIFSAIPEPRNQAVALVSIGLIYQDAGDFERALSYYHLANDVFPGDAMLRLSNSNNQANALAGLRRFTEAEDKYKQALAEAERLGSPVLQARILNNIADTEVEADRLGEAAASLRRGLAVAPPGTTAAEWRPMLLATAAKLKLAEHDPRGAVALVEQATAGHTRSELENQTLRDLHQTAYRAYRAMGAHDKALASLEAYRKLDDEGRALVTQTSAALLAARFDFANQNARISTLKAGQLARDIALNRAAARQNAIILGSLLAIATVVATLLALYLRVLYRSRRATERANAALSEVNTELTHALSAKSRFLATTSHEIRTPLNGVLGMTQVLLRDPQVEGEVRERVGLVHQAGESMRMLVDDILEFAKIDAGTVDTVAADMDLHELLQDIARFWRPQAASKGLMLTLDLGDTPAHIVGDARRIRQILFNLLSNALKFTGAGTIAVTAATTCDGSRLVVAVADTGIGIAGTAHESIFEKFNQLDTSTTRMYGGTGLGLSISRSLARAMSGDVEVASAAGCGATFTLALPLVRATPRPEPAVTVKPASAAGRGRIVLVGGAPLAQSVIASLLRPVAGSVATVPGVSAALAGAVLDAADLIIVDSATEDASAVGRLLAAVGEGYGRVVIRLAADGEDADGSERHGVRVVTRPVNRATLLAAVAEAFRDMDADARETSLV